MPILLALKVISKFYLDIIVEAEVMVSVALQEG